MTEVQSLDNCPQTRVLGNMIQEFREDGRVRDCDMAVERIDCSDVDGP